MLDISQPRNPGANKYHNGPQLNFSPSRFSQYAKDLSKAVYDLSDEMKYRITEPVFFLHRERKPGEIMESQLGPYRYHVDGGYKRTPQFEEVSMTLTGYQPGAIKAAIEKAKQEAQSKVSEAMAKLAAAHIKATEEVPAAIKTYAAKIEKEASDAIQELAEFDNGGPVLDDVTALPEHKL